MKIDEETNDVRVELKNVTNYWQNASTKFHKHSTYLHRDHRQCRRRRRRHVDLHEEIILSKTNVLSTNNFDESTIFSTNRDKQLDIDKQEKETNDDPLLNELNYVEMKEFHNQLIDEWFHFLVHIDINDDI